MSDYFRLRGLIVYAITIQLYNCDTETPIDNT